MNISVIFMTLVASLMAVVLGPMQTNAGVGYYYYKPVPYYVKKVHIYPSYHHYYRPSYYKRRYYW